MVPEKWAQIVLTAKAGVKEGMSEAILGHKGDGKRRDVRPNG